jgi:hypothetical protein
LHPKKVDKGRERQELGEEGKSNSGEDFAVQPDPLRPENAGGAFFKFF